MDFHSPLIGRPRPKVDGLEESLQNLIRRSVGMARDGVMMWPSCYRQDAVTLRFGGILFFLGGGLGWVKVGGDWEWTCSLLTLKKTTSDYIWRFSWRGICITIFQSFDDFIHDVMWIFMMVMSPGYLLHVETVDPRDSNRLSWAASSSRLGLTSFHGKNLLYNP